MTNLLTVDEIQYLLDGCHSSNTWTLVERTVAATVAKLAAGVSVEPSYFMTFRADSGRIDTPYHTPAALTTAIAAARVAALEDAAKECDRTSSDYKGMFAEDESLYIAATDCAKEIRALIGAKTCTSDEWLANCPQSVRDLANKIKGETK